MTKVTQECGHSFHNKNEEICPFRDHFEDSMDVDEIRKK